MTRFCFYDGCNIPEERLRRGSLYGTDACRRAARIEERRDQAKRECRLCSRPINRRYEAMRKALREIAKSKKTKSELVALAQATLRQLVLREAQTPAKRN